MPGVVKTRPRSNYESLSYKDQKQYVQTSSYTPSISVLSSLSLYLAIQKSTNEDPSKLRRDLNLLAGAHLNSEQLIRYRMSHICVPVIAYSKNNW